MRDKSVKSRQDCSGKAVNAAAFKTNVELLLQKQKEEEEVQRKEKDERLADGLNIFK